LKTFKKKQEEEEKIWSFNKGIRKIMLKFKTRKTNKKEEIHVKAKKEEKKKLI
jgi:hypothetical protein